MAMEKGINETLSAVRNVTGCDIISLIGLLASMSALVISFVLLRQKKGISISGTYSINQNPDFSCAYYGNVVLENLKDKSVAIYSINMLFENKVLLVIEELYDEPLILHPFETISRKLDPVLMYGMSIYPEDVNILILRDEGRLVVSTSQGMYKIKNNFERQTTFKHRLSGKFKMLLLPRRKIFDGKSVGDKVLFVVVAKDDLTGQIYEETITFENSTVLGVSITDDLLESRESLESFLVQNKSGVFSNCTVKVHRIGEGDDSFSKFKRHFIIEKRSFFSRYGSKLKFIKSQKH